MSEASGQKTEINGLRQRGTNHQASDADKAQNAGQDPHDRGDPHADPGELQDKEKKTIGRTPDGTSQSTM